MQCNIPVDQSTCERPFFYLKGKQTALLWQTDWSSQTLVSLVASVRPLHYFKSLAHALTAAGEVAHIRAQNLARLVECVTISNPQSSST